jgi:hypothetical protein
MIQDTNARCSISRTLLLYIGLLALFGGCSPSASVLRDEELKGEAEQRLQERAAFKVAVENYLKDTQELPRSSPRIVLVAGEGPVVPRPECTDYGCPTAVRCEAAQAVCYVTHCGKGSCNLCPAPMPEAFKSLIFKQWCEFECVQGPTRMGTVIGFVPSIGKGFVGPFGCPSE